MSPVKKLMQPAVADAPEALFLRENAPSNL